MAEYNGLCYTPTCPYYLIIVQTYYCVIMMYIRTLIALLTTGDTLFFYDLYNRLVTIVFRQKILHRILVAKHL